MAAALHRGGTNEIAPSLTATSTAMPCPSHMSLKEIIMATNQSSGGSKSGSSTGNVPKGEGSSKQKEGGTAKRGFAAMDEEQQREIASKGGQAAHQKGTAHEFDSEEARRAGQKGGEAVSRNREHMADIGRKGGESRQAASRSANETKRGDSEQSSDKASKQSSKDDE